MSDVVVFREALQFGLLPAVLILTFVVMQLRSDIKDLMRSINNKVDKVEQRISTLERDCVKLQEHYITSKECKERLRTLEERRAEG